MAPYANPFTGGGLPVNQFSFAWGQGPGLGGQATSPADQSPMSALGQYAMLPQFAGMPAARGTQNPLMGSWATTSPSQGTTLNLMQIALQGILGKLGLPDPFGTLGGGGLAGLSGASAAHPGGQSDTTTTGPAAQSGIPEGSNRSAPAPSAVPGPTAAPTPAPTPSPTAASSVTAAGYIPRQQDAWDRQNLIGSNGTFSSGDLQGLTLSQAMAACGPIAAVAFAAAHGRAPTVAEAFQMAQQNGWWANGEMQGPQAEDSLLQKMGYSPTFSQGAPDWSQVEKAASASHPIIVSTPNHYFVVEGYDPTKGLYVGNSGTTMKGGNAWLSPDLLTSLGGGSISGTLQ